MFQTCPCKVQYSHCSRERRAIVCFNGSLGGLGNEVIVVVFLGNDAVKVIAFVGRTVN